MPYSFANLLRDIRRANDLSQADAARLIGVRQQTYANWELGAVPRPVPARDTAHRHYVQTISGLCAFVGQPPNVLLPRMLVPGLDPDRIPH